MRVLIYSFGYFANSCTKFRHTGSGILKGNVIDVVMDNPTVYPYYYHISLNFSWNSTKWKQHVDYTNSHHLIVMQTAYKRRNVVLHLCVHWHNGVLKTFPFLDLLKISWKAHCHCWAWETTILVFLHSMRSYLHYIIWLSWIPRLLGLKNGW